MKQKYVSFNQTSRFYDMFKIISHTPNLIELLKMMENDPERFADDEGPARGWGGQRVLEF